MTLSMLRHCSFNAFPWYFVSHNTNYMYVQELPLKYVQFFCFLSNITRVYILLCIDHSVICVTVTYICLNFQGLHKVQTTITKYNYKSIKYTLRLYIYLYFWPSQISDLEAVVEIYLIALPGISCHWVLHVAAIGPLRLIRSSLWHHAHGTIRYFCHI